MYGAARVLSFLLILMTLSAFAAPADAERPPETAAAPTVCTGSTTLGDDTPAVCEVDIPRCVSTCKSYMVEITVEATGAFGGATTPYVTAAFGGTQRCSGLATCTATLGPYPEHKIVGISLDCEGWGADGFVGINRASSLTVTCTRTTV